MVRYLPIVARILLGLLFTMTGVNGFYPFLPMPKTPFPEQAMAFSMALLKSGYMMKLVAGTQLVCGVLLLMNRFVPLALAMLAPVVVNIALFHIFLAPVGYALAIVVFILEIYLAWAYRKAFRPMLAARVSLNGD
jgi:uncharacterized membrane protein YphA (DoxX/SURF4 family)